MYIKLGSMDFFAIDVYQSPWVIAPNNSIAACLNNTSHPLWPECHNVRVFDLEGSWAGGPEPDPLAKS
jgi:beta-glucosidase